MEIQRAMEIVRFLSEEKDPNGSQWLPKESPYQQGEVVCALRVALDGLRALEQKIKRKDERPKNSGIPWGTEEDRELIKSFKCGKTIHELAKQHRRTAGAIHSRLIKLGVIRVSSSIRDNGM